MRTLAAISDVTRAAVGEESSILLSISSAPMSSPPPCLLFLLSLEDDFFILRSRTPSPSPIDDLGMMSSTRTSNTSIVTLDPTLSAPNLWFCRKNVFIISCTAVASSPVIALLSSRGIVKVVAISTLAGVGDADGDILGDADGALDGPAEGEMVGTLVGKYDGRDEGGTDSVGVELG